MQGAAGQRPRWLASDNCNFRRTTCFRWDRYGLPAVATAQDGESCRGSANLFWEAHPSSQVMVVDVNREAAAIQPMAKPVMARVSAKPFC